MDDADQGMEASAATIRDRVRRQNAFTLNHQQAIYTEKLRPSLKYEDLIVDPRDSVVRIVSSLLPELMPKADADIPSFADLHRVDPAFFRCGGAGAHREEMLPALHELFWAQPENATAMRQLGYG